MQIGVLLDLHSYPVQSIRCEWLICNTLTLQWVCSICLIKGIISLLDSSRLWSCKAWILHILYLGNQYLKCLLTLKHCNKWWIPWVKRLKGCLSTTLLLLILTLNTIEGWNQTSSNRTIIWMLFYSKTNTSSSNEFHLPSQNPLWKTPRIETDELQTCHNEKKKMNQGIKQERCIPEHLKQPLKSLQQSQKSMKLGMMSKSTPFSLL